MCADLINLKGGVCKQNSQEVDQARCTMQLKQPAPALCMCKEEMDPAHGRVN